MYKILIVDDEYRHRDGLTKLITNVYPSYMIREAENGQQALDIIEEEDIDLVITDIKMPIMSGIELIEAIDKLNIKIKIIMLSAYGEFEYAQKAIQLGTFDYILKPISKKQVTEVLEKAVKVINHENLIETRKINQERSLELSLPIYVDNLLSKWVRNKTNSVENEEVATIIESFNRGVILITHIEELEYKLISEESDDNNIKYRIKNILRESIRQIGKSISFYDSYNSYQIISIIIMEDQSITTLQDKKSLCMHWVNKIQDVLDSKVYMAISQIEEALESNPYKIYKKTEETLDKRFYSSDVIFYNVDTDFIKYQHCNRYDEEKKIELAILNIEEHVLIKEIKILFKKIISHGMPYPTDLKKAIFMIFRDIIMKLNVGLLEEYEKKMISRLETMIIASKSYGQLHNEMVNIMLEFLKEIHEFKDQKDQVIFKQVMGYIQENYDQDISLEEMAEKVYLSAPYFSKVFKSISGMTFTKYVQNVRLTKAKELLTTTHDKIYKIASRVGYNDSKYFNRVFRNEMGITPNEYRHLSIGSIELGGDR